MKKIFLYITILFTFLIPNKIHAQDFPEFQSDYIYVIDMDNQQVLFEKNSQEKMYPASLTKMMSAILCIEYFQDLNQTIEISEQMLDGLAQANASVAGLKLHESYTVEELLYGVLLPSGADAINALALTKSGSIEQFVDEMNQKAQALQMQNTHFQNPTGLHDENHYSTAYDMAILLKYCYQNETFKKIISTRSFQTHDNLLLKSTISDTLFEVEGFQGGKTGYTKPAGRCLASIFSFDQIHVSMIFAHSLANDGHIQDTNTMMHFLNTNFTKKEPIQKNQVLDSYLVKNSFFPTKLTFVAQTPLQIDLQNDDTIQTSSNLNITNKTIHKGDTLGDYTISTSSNLTYKYTYISDETIYSIPPFAFINQHPITLVFLVLFVLFWIWVEVEIGKRKRHLRRKKSRKA